MATAQRAFVNGHFGQIHVRIARPETADREPLVCLHMFPQSGRNFCDLLHLISDRRIAVAPDFPGYGESDPPPHEVNAEAYAESVWQVVDELDLLQASGKVHLFGVHAGAKLAVAATRQRPQAVGRLILSSAAVLSESEIAKLKQTLSPVPLDDEGTRFARIWSMVTQNRGPGMTQEMMALAFAEIVRWGSAYLWGSSAVFEYNRQFPEDVAALPHEIVLLNPKDDLYEMTPRTLPYLQNGRLIDLPDWGHGFLQAQSRQVAEALNGLLA